MKACELQWQFFFFLFFISFFFFFLGIFTKYLKVKKMPFYLKKAFDEDRTFSN